jgi:hypothetical protein
MYENENSSRVNEETTLTNGASQEGVHMDSATKTRKPYDGSKAHGVTPKNIVTILEYDNSLERFKMRYEYLVKEYKTIQVEFEATQDISERATLLKKKSSKESQMMAVVKVKNELVGMRAVIEQKEIVSQKGADFTILEF